VKWIIPIPIGFLLMMLYAGAMGRELLETYPIGNPRLLWEEYLIITAILYFIMIIPKRITSPFFTIFKKTPKI
tara:strand:+ start:87 stop:305 length:219 start_codon:yes stop_codon:yes gene_type:complete